MIMLSILSDNKILWEVGQLSKQEASKEWQNNIRNQVSKYKPKLKEEQNQNTRKQAHTEPNKQQINKTSKEVKQ